MTRPTQQQQQQEQQQESSTRYTLEKGVCFLSHATDPACLKHGVMALHSIYYL